jgi:hypothetical protein
MINRAGPFAKFHQLGVSKGRRITVKRQTRENSQISWGNEIMSAPSPLYAIGGVEDRSSLRLPWRLPATRFARILKAGRTRGSSASGRFLW